MPSKISRIWREYGEYAPIYLANVMGLVQFYRGIITPWLAIARDECIGTDIITDLESRSPPLAFCCMGNATHGMWIMADP